VAIYVVTDRQDMKWVKIGYASNVQRRMAELQQERNSGCSSYSELQLVGLHTTATLSDERRIHNTLSGLEGHSEWYRVVPVIEFLIDALQDEKLPFEELEKQVKDLNLSKRKDSINGCVYRRKDSKFWWIKYIRDGQIYQESSKSDCKEDALEMLRYRVTARRKTPGRKRKTWLNDSGVGWALNATK
jgi:hypothetical protein